MHVQCKGRIAFVCMCICLCVSSTGLNQTGFGLSEHETMTLSLKCLLTVEINETLVESGDLFQAQWVCRWLQEICKTFVVTF